jgi:hypothetical protein
MPIVLSTSDEQKVDQDTAENKGEGNQKPQNRIHHGYLQADRFNARTQSIMPEAIQAIQLYTLPMRSAQDVVGSTP